ncbi:MAG: 4Fe-4S dicluster domain-containing protein [Bacteroidetes bacterium]|nr:MAG: 4Fe-4S dicluster domain-containing protein [Bacteroidota bacterium]
MNLTIDNQKIEISRPSTILDVAGQHGIDIPSLCAHPELTPYGGCRLCVVEIEGRNGYPTSCTTLAEEGMIVRTNTNVLQEIRREVIQLILSEHPAACLMCEDVEGCHVFQGTIRKVGITTGCRWCPKDQDCELQRIVEQFGIHDLTLPGLYRDLPLEKYDPFFDRDYNLCIYCGRCVRICTEYRKSSILSLRQRGKLTTIGPAFDETHVDANCEFCGACVSVCPTGAMSEKSRKWWGKPERMEPSVCPLCSLNCDIQVLTLNEKIVGTLPPGKAHESGGDLCVKGRFCLSELVNRTERILEPEFRYPEGYGIVSWDFALEKVREIIQVVPAHRAALFISPDLTLEELYTAGFFGRNVLETDEITSSCLDAGLIAYLKLAEESVSLKEFEKAGTIFSAFLNGNYNYAPLTLAIKSSAGEGVPYYQLGWIADTTSRFARHRFIPKPGEAESYLGEIISFLKNGKCNSPEISELAGSLKKEKRGIIVVGTQILSLSNGCVMLDKIRQIATLTKSGLYMPNPYGNLYGMLSLIRMKPVEEVLQQIREGRIDLLYVVGDVPFTERPDVKYVIYQNAFPPPKGLNPDVALPTTLWGETGGSIRTDSGTIKRFKSHAVSHGYARPHIEVFSGIAGTKKIPKAGFPQKTIREALSGAISLPATGPGKQALSAGKSPAPDRKFPYVLIQEKNPHTYSNLNLGVAISAFGELVMPGHLILHPMDAGKVGVKQGDPVILHTPAKKLRCKAAIRKIIPPGTVYLTSVNGELEFENNPCYVTIKRDHV